MKRPIVRIVLPIFFLLIIVTSLTHVFGQEYSSSVVTGSGSTMATPIETAEQADEIEARVRQEKEAVARAWDAKVQSSQAVIQQQQLELLTKTGDMARLKQQIEEFSTRLEELRNQIVSLDTEKKILEHTLQLTGLKIQNVELEIEEKKRSIRETYGKIDFATTTTDVQERIVARFIALLYKQQKLYFKDQNSLAEDPAFLLSNEGISSFILKRRYADRMREVGTEVLGDLQQIQALLDFRKKQLLLDQEQLQELERRLQIERISYEQQKESTQILLSTTKGEEALFQRLIQEAIEEEKRIEEEVQAMQANIGNIEDQIRMFSVTVRSGQLTDAEIQERVKILMELGGDGKVGLDWPVAATRISAGFREPSYARRFGVAHNAVDLPAPQGSNITAPADGYVTKVKDNGYGYSYIVLAHNGGIMTLYGHVSKILVNVGDFVKRGDVIGHVGGTPGTLGAGWMTTGPHLHFEVFLNGKHVDPLLFLDSSKLK